jgi:hypothetical protein
VAVVDRGLSHGFRDEDDFLGLLGQDVSLLGEPLGVVILPLARLLEVLVVHLFALRRCRRPHGLAMNRLALVIERRRHDWLAVGVDLGYELAHDPDAGRAVHRHAEAFLGGVRQNVERDRLGGDDARNRAAARNLGQGLHLNLVGDARAGRRRVLGYGRECVVAAVKRALEVQVFKVNRCDCAIHIEIN